MTSDPAAPVGPLTIYKIGNYWIGRRTVYQPDGKQTAEPIAEGLLEVPEAGLYQVHCGSGDASGIRMAIDGKARR